MPTLADFLKKNYPTQAPSKPVIVILPLDPIGKALQAMDLATRYREWNSVADLFSYDMEILRSTETIR